MPSLDLMHRFIFDEHDVLGEIVTLSDSYSEIQKHNGALPAEVNSLLGELCAATCLLSSSLKFSGLISIQLRGSGHIPMMMAECSHHRAIRGIVRWANDLSLTNNFNSNVAEMFPDGQLIITVEPDKGQRYQGMTPLEWPRLSEALEQYFLQSVQLKTRFWFAAEGDRSSGLMLQALPKQKESAEDGEMFWQHINCIANTVQSTELLELEHQQLLHRLFHEEKVCVFEPLAIHFACSCSRERSANALASLGRAEVEKLLIEQDPIHIDCQFCNRAYLFSRDDLATLFPNADRSLH